MQNFRKQKDYFDTYNIVPTNQNYHYSLMMQNIKELKTVYPFLEVGSIGKSVLGKELPYIRIGEGKRQVLYHAAMHANEWITSILLMKFIENFCKAYAKNKSIYGQSAKKIFEQISLYIIPMMNPDTIDLVTGQLSPNTIEYQNYKKISESFTSIPFPNGWKANYHGVDLNLQFPAGWENAKKIKFEQGYNKPAPRDFVGIEPLIESESLAIYNFTLSHDFDLTISYHTQGEEIYWNFQKINPSNGYEIGRKFAELSEYALTEVPYNSSFAGFKDWYILNYHRPGYTIEAGLGESPLPISQFEKIYNDNEGILVYGMILK